MFLCSREFPRSSNTAAIPEWIQKCSFTNNGMHVSKSIQKIQLSTSFLLKGKVVQKLNVTFTPVTSISIVHYYSFCDDGTQGKLNIGIPELK